jgi:class 3 adenylate cyclase/DNA-binding SARP family transcriptional activator
MRFGILGPFEVADDRGRPVALGGPRQRAVLAILLLHADRVVLRDRLIEELWGAGAPATAVKTVQVYVSNLRKAIGDGVLLTRAGGYVLRNAREEVDVARFEALVAEGRGRLVAGDARGAAGSLRAGLGLWRGAPLADFTYEAFAQGEIARLEEARWAALEDRIEAELALGEHAALVGELEALMSEQPLRERLHALLMVALYRSGRQAEALDAYQRVHAQLYDELGLEPGVELRGLQAAILNHDQSLAAPPRTASAGPAEPASGDGAATAGPSAGKASGPAGSGIVGDREQALSAFVRARPSRKVVTVLFIDMTGSTALGEELDPEVLHGVIGRCFEEIRATIERHGGTVAKFTGGAVMAVFGIPRVREDDALRAVRSAAEIRQTLPAVAEHVGVGLRFRTGVNTGLVLVGEGENVAIGDAVNVAARLEQAARPDEILLGLETLRLVRDAVRVEPLAPLALKGKSRPVTAFRLLDVDPHSPAFLRRFDVPLVGRARELGLLRDAWDRAVAESGCHLFTLLGAAGVGKSRLVAELLSALGDVWVLSGRCLHYGEGITFWPLQEALAIVGEPTERVLQRLKSGGAATPEELFFEVRRSLESLAAERPVILHVDDLQWAEPTLLDLLDHIVDLSRGAPILLLCAGRPELLEDRPGWGGGKLNATSLLLEPLTTRECEALLDSLGDGLDLEARARVVLASDGNPLFLQEMAALARETGTVAVPATIQALLAARLEGLEVEEREALEHGAIEGEVFHRAAVLALSSERTETKVDLQLAGLVRKELIRPHPATIQGEYAFRFRHLLIRDAAYDALPKARRADLHEKFARWLEQAVIDLVELDEIAGWHLEQTLRCQRELGQRPNEALGRDAADHLHTAGRRARERRDVPAAKHLLERARALAQEGDTRRALIAADLAEVLVEAGELASADQLLTDIERDSDVSAVAALTRFEWMMSARPRGSTRAIASRLPGLLKHFARVGDERSLARAHMVAYFPHWLRARWAAAGDEFRLAAQHARNAGDDGLWERALAGYVATLQYGRADPRTTAQELDAIEREQPGSYLMASVDLMRGELARRNGNYSEARRLAKRASERLRSLGLPEMEAGCEAGLGDLELSAGDPTAALAALQRSDAILAQLGERGLRSTTQALLSQAYCRLGNTAAADAAIERSEELGDPDDVVNLIITHGVRAQRALGDGDGEAAERWARSAVNHASSTDSLVQQANTKLELARVLTALKRPQEAVPAARAALDLFLTVGDRPSAHQTRALLHELGADP